MAGIEFSPEIAWASGRDPSDNIITLRMDRQFDLQEQDYIPPNFRMAGEDQNGNVREVKLNSDGGFIS